MREASGLFDGVNSGTRVEELRLLDCSRGDSELGVS